MYIIFIIFIWVLQGVAITIDKWFSGKWLLNSCEDPSFMHTNFIHATLLEDCQKLLTLGHLLCTWLICQWITIRWPSFLLAKLMSIKGNFTMWRWSWSILQKCNTKTQRLTEIERSSRNAQGKARSFRQVTHVNVRCQPLPANHLSFIGSQPKIVHKIGVVIHASSVRPLFLGAEFQHHLSYRFPPSAHMINVDSPILPCLSASLLVSRSWACQTGNICNRNNTNLKIFESV